MGTTFTSWADFGGVEFKGDAHFNCYDGDEGNRTTFLDGARFDVRMRTFTLSVPRIGPKHKNINIPYIN